MRFEIELENGEIGWAFLKEVTILPIFEEFCRYTKPELKPLLYETAVLPRIVKETVFNSNVVPGTIFYLTVKFFDKTGEEYEELDNEKFPLPDLYHTNYLFECVYGTYSGTNKQFISYEIKVLNKFGKFNAFMSTIYGCKFTLDVQSDVLITLELLKKHNALRKFVSKKF